MAAEPIHVEADEEVPAVIERIRRSPADEVHLVLPARARFGQSRFNFQLLKQYSTRLGKRVAIVTPDPSVQRFAEESGFGAFRVGDAGGPLSRGAARTGHVVLPVPPDQPGPFVPGRGVAGPGGPGPFVPGRGPVRPGGQTSWGPQPPGAAGGHGQPPPASQLGSISRISRSVTRTRTPIRIGVPRRLPGLAARFELSRYVLYGGAGILLLVGMVGMAFYVPSARVTLVVQAQAFPTSVDVTAEPGKAPIRVRTVTVTKSDSLSGQATGTKTSGGQYATGEFTYDNNCPFALSIPNGQRLRAANGAVFAQLGDQIVPQNHSATVSIKATQTGQAGNVGAGQITGIEGSQYDACLTGANAQATGGGVDDQKQTVIQSSDLQSVRARLEQQLRQAIMDELNHGLQKGEKLVNDPVWGVGEFATDHQVDENVARFTGTMKVQAEGDYYLSDDVDKVFAEQLASKVPAGRELTANKVAVSYTVTAASGGHLDFNGTASGYVTAQIDTNRVRSQLVGKTGGQAHDLLDRLPISRADIKMSPIPLPLMPLSPSRITIDYAVDQVVAPAKSP